MVIKAGCKWNKNFNSQRGHDSRSSDGGRHQHSLLDFYIGSHRNRPLQTVYPLQLSIQTVESLFKKLPCGLQPQ